MIAEITPELYKLVTVRFSQQLACQDIPEPSCQQTEADFRQHLACTSMNIFAWMCCYEIASGSLSGVGISEKSSLGYLGYHTVL